MKSKLIKERGHRCEGCGLCVWQNVPIPLEIHHVYGRLEEEVQLLCPNCHALTPNYRGKGIRTAKNVSDEEVRSAVDSSNNLKQLLENLNLVAKGGNYQTIRLRLSKLNLLGKFRQPEIIKVCPFCKLEFVGNKTFCSQGCSNKFHRNGIKTKKVVNRPSNEVLLQMIATMGFCATGRVFGVSDNAVRKWLR